MAVTNIRIIDPHLIRQVEAEQARRGDGNPTKTAQRLLVERLAQLELTHQINPPMQQTPADAAA